LFLLEQNLNFTQIFILQSALALSVACCQLPSGYFSDRYGRRRTLIMGAVCDILGILTYAMSTSFGGFLVANVLIGAAISFFSGSIEALAYESLTESGADVKTFRKTMGHLTFARFIAEALASLAATVIIVIGLRATFWLTLIPVGIEFIAAWTLCEPRRHQIEETQHLKAVLRICRMTLHNGALRSIIILDNILTGLGLLLYWFTQPYQNEIGLPVIFFGAVHAGIVLTGALAARATHTVERVLSDKWFYIVLSTAIIGSYLMLGTTLSFFCLALFFVVRSAWGMLTPLSIDIISRLSDPSARATILSIRGLTFQLLYFAFPPLLGSLADRTSVSVALLTAGMIGGSAVLITFGLMTRTWGTIER
jgi:MFS family permease